MEEEEEGSVFVGDDLVQAISSQRLEFVDLQDLLPLYGIPESHRAFNEASAVIGKEPPVTAEGEPINFKPIEGLEKTYEFLIQRYVEYVALIRTMDACMGQLIHPQKRLLFKRFIEAIAGRLCEMKNEMNKLTRTNVHNLVACVQDLGLTPDDMNYKIPYCLLEDQKASLGRRERILTTMLDVMATQDGCTLSDLVSSIGPKDDKQRAAADGKSAARANNAKPSLQPPTTKFSTPSSSVRQDSEVRRGSASQAGKKDQLTLGPPSPKASEGRYTNQEMSDFLNSRRYKEWLAEPRFHEQVQMLQNQWRLWIARQGIKVIEQSADEMIDMIPPQLTVNWRSVEEEQIAAQRWMCEERSQEYTVALDPAKENYYNGCGHFDRWQLHLNLEQWALELRDMMGKCPLYPEPEVGGCSALFTLKTIQEVMDDLDEIEGEDKKKKPAAKDKDKNKKKKGEDKGKGKGKKDKNEAFLWVMPKSGIVPGLVSALQDFAGYWNLKVEDIDEEQRFDLQLVQEKVRTEAEETIRTMVDAMMVAELEKLRAVDREPPPKPDKKKKDKKDKKGKKGKKGKRNPVDGLSEDELFAELVLMGIARRPLEVTMDDLVGAANVSDKFRETCRVPTPPDLKMALREMYGLPLTSGTIHSMMELHNSVLLAGPPGSGKKLLVHGLCRETGANLVDLSPAKMVGKYQGKKQEDYLMSALLKVGKSMEPTVFLVDECHLMFPTKKSPKRPHVDRDKPARWARMWTRLMKKLVPGDRMLLVGVTNLPFFAKSSAMFKLFPVVYLFPFPDYGTRVELWRHFLDALKFARPHNIDVSTIAKMTKGLTGGAIKKAIDSAVPPARIRSKKRLQSYELIRALAQTFPVEGAPDQDAWITWYLTSPEMVARAAVIQKIVEDEELAAAAASKKK